MTLTVAEAFGPTIQGEGPSTGRRAGFLRLGHCNLDCRWCDTAYTWDWTGKNGVAYDPAVELSTWTTEQTVDALLAMDVGLVVVTGGEPMLQRRALQPVIAALRTAGVTVEVETNGTVSPGDLAGMVRFNCSPKLANSGVTRAKARRDGPLTALAAVDSIFKFVVTAPSDLDEIADFADRYQIPAGRIWVMPEGVNAAAVTAGMAAVVDELPARGWNLSTRLHVLLWGDKRGV